jgi:hypothetical protein
MLFSEATSMIIISVVYGIVIFCTLKIRQTLRENAMRRQKKESRSLQVFKDFCYVFVLGTATQVTNFMILQVIKFLYSFKFIP